MISKYVGIDLSKYRFLRQLKFKLGIFFGVYQDGLKDVRKVIKQYVKKDFLCVDVGASVGDVTKMLSKKGKFVYSFEPQESTYLELKNRFKRTVNIMIYKYALSNNSGVSLFYEREYGCHSGLLTAGLSKTINSYQVKTIKLDALCIMPDFIKIDTEGNELDVLIGGIDTIKKNHPIIFVECWEGSPKEIEIKNFLSECGYTNIKRFSNDILAIN